MRLALRFAGLLFAIPMLLLSAYFFVRSMVVVNFVETQAKIRIVELQRNGELDLSKSPDPNGRLREIQHELIDPVVGAWRFSNMVGGLTSGVLAVVCLLIIIPEKSRLSPVAGPSPERSGDR